MSKEAEQVIKNAEEDNVLALQLKAKGYTTIIEAKEIKNKKDMTQVFKKDPED